MIKKFFILAVIIGIIFGFSKLNLQQTSQKKEFVLWTIQLKPVAQEIIEENIEKFEKKHPDYKVVWVDIPIAEAQKRTLAAILGGNPPDLVNLNPDFSVILAQKGALEYFSEQEGEKFEPSSIDLLRYEDKIYALPFYATSSITLYNKELYNSCGYNNPPKTYDELSEIAQNLKACSKIYPFAINLNENDSLAKILNKYNVSEFSDEKDFKNTLFVYKMFDEMYKNNLISKDTLTINHREMAEKYMSENALFVVLGSNFINMVKENAPEVYKKSDVSEQLLGKSGKYDISLMNFIIPKRSKNKALAHEFADLITDEASQIKLAKLTNVIPLNSKALEDEYFSQCEYDLMSKAKCISIKQLKSSGNKDFGVQNKKEINENINKTAELILLNNLDEKTIEAKITKLAQKINELKQ